LMRQVIVAVDKFAKCEHRDAARCRRSGDYSGGSVAPAPAKGKRENWPATLGFGKMLAGTTSLLI
jgi:hypothetical protein